MEADEDQQYPSHCFNLYEGNPSRNNDFNSMFLQNPHDEDFHVHDHHQVDNHDQHHHHHQPSVVVDQEKRLRRMASNRESARRSRMRERKKMERLTMQAAQLMASNQFLSDKYISLLEYNHQISQENSQLKKTVSSLFQEYTIFHGEHHDDTPRFIHGFDLNQQYLHQPT
ncbi:PREDICTED: bZIP transcription factor 2 [Camelina sativa]|uniref:BZIP transcription factor 2 n=1 Tax=Camelina sativa TaxID=90675 RepID=A0ABM0XV34_CAMSA|nr:PREDICTED: bZIP transcription factor 2 [Camelina sativa]